MAKELTPAHCILLTVHYASAGDVNALHSFTPTRLDALDPELVLRILLTYLPESIEPKEYTKYVEEVASRLYLDYSRKDVEVDVSPVEHLSAEQAKKQVKKLHLLNANPPQFPAYAPPDLITRFVCHRAERIDGQTGLLDLIPPLVEPFLDRNDYIRRWYVSVVLPLLRLHTVYYPHDESLPGISLSDFSQLEGPAGIDFLLKKGEQVDGKVPTQSGGSTEDTATRQKATTIARDVKGLVGPWMYGHTDRKRRKVRHGQHDSGDGDLDGVDDVERRVRKISLSGVTEDDKTGHDWEYMYQWLVNHATSNFPCVSHCIEDWDGPGDVDFGGIVKGSRDYLDEDVQTKLELQYAQAAFAACYAARDDAEEAIQGAHGILARLAELLDFVPPPDLASSVESLPKIERHVTRMDHSQTIVDLEPTRLLEPEHPLTTPRMETYMLLQMMVYSAYQFSGLGQPITLADVAKLHFYASPVEQLAVLRKLLSHLEKSDKAKTESQWTADRAKLLWLWNWGIAADDEDAKNGAGVLGKIVREDFEEEMLKVFVETSCYHLASKLFITDRRPETRLPLERIERVVLETILAAYDSASSGNKLRGRVKKASAILTAFHPYFQDSIRLRRASALISATHALSFYSLTLQHGVPFKPAHIRVSSDPISLIDKVLEQNPRSYTKLDDLIGIAQNFIAAGLPPTDDENIVIDLSNIELLRRRQEAERRVTFMAVEAALGANDFETAYSYIMNRLTPSGAGIVALRDQKQADTDTNNNSTTGIHSTGQPEDDISWRSAFLAGRYRPATSSPPTLRRLEQRTELLSLALLLAPTSALPEILTVWRRCEDETMSLHLAQQQAEEEFDDRADKRVSVSSLPGHFSVGGEQPDMVLNQKRREMGRIGAAPSGATGGPKGGDDEAPMSMFDLTRSAARAFSINAFPLRAGTTTSSMAERRTEEEGMEASMDSLRNEGEGSQRVRRRDMVASAVSGGLASGLGWMLGATPVEREQE